MEFYNIYGRKPGSEVKLLFSSLIESGLKNAFKTADENGYEIETVIKIGSHNNFYIDEIVTDEIKNKIQGGN